MWSLIFYFSLNIDVVATISSDFILNIDPSLFIVSLLSMNRLFFSINVHPLRVSFHKTTSSIYFFLQLHICRILLAMLNIASIKGMVLVKPVPINVLSNKGKVYAKMIL